MDDRPLPETCCPEQPTLWIQPGQATYLGPSFDLGPHSGSVHCFALGIDAPFELHAADIGEQRVRSAFIPARTRHQIIARTGRMLFSYSLSNNARELMAVRTKTVAYNHRDERALIQSVRTAPAPLRLTTETKLDERIRAAMRALRADPDLSAATLAAKTHLSTSRFLHLFTENAGTTLRRYRMWTRMTRVAAAISTGANLTTAATDAGFASANHFSDTFRTMFGLTASTLLAVGTRIVTQRSAEAAG
ncbi:AraC family transcriptional regulator [Kibdelosporangium persicum]|uniref:DNA-binding transcriptional regulator AraC n=1 Tax=Kibdelosporangium persicum TaxID=2698649 RepID=A0ABX2F6F1_9PSEU|nr:AraC family transcriptional regulator [Kibdelosporangium persicum]NRN66545.1 DNA-binding transcriptional regulator AraC [Kibdelosporangium persicum]